MKLKIIFIFLALSFVVESSYQQESLNNEEPLLEENELIFIFSVSIAVVIGILLFLSRDYILRKKGEYERENFESKKNRDYEKYHSEWTSDDIDFGNKNKNNYKSEDFRKASINSSLPNYYEILGISSDSSQVDIKKQFRILVKEWHPDKNKDPATEKKMAKINEAYEVLSNPERKAQYDKYLKKK